MPTSDMAIEVLPVLPSLDFDETQAFYGDELGFGVVYSSATRLILRRVQIELHFWKTDQRVFCENSSCYLRGGGIDALYAEFSERKVPGLSDYEVRPWDMKEFYIHDPHGNLLTFARIP
ncbi:bleomycin resistance protein [Roseibium sp.]|uniref:bleomycin resistance protein n=1 Tax=Roseibium sp. TaxID=1936156 RepID=UPI003A9723D5